MCERKEVGGCSEEIMFKGTDHIYICKTTDYDVCALFKSLNKE